MHIIRQCSENQTVGSHPAHRQLRAKGDAPSHLQSTPGRGVAAIAQQEAGWLRGAVRMSSWLPHAGGVVVGGVVASGVGSPWHLSLHSGKPKTYPMRPKQLVSNAKHQTLYMSTLNHELGDRFRSMCDMRNSCLRTTNYERLVCPSGFYK
jgi:hypothetical protein